MKIEREDFTLYGSFVGIFSSLTFVAVEGIKYIKESNIVHKTTSYMPNITKLYIPALDNISKLSRLHVLNLALAYSCCFLLADKHISKISDLCLNYLLKNKYCKASTAHSILTSINFIVAISLGSLTVKSINWMLRRIDVVDTCSVNELFILVIFNSISLLSCYLANKSNSYLAKKIKRL